MDNSEEQQPAARPENSPAASSDTSQLDEEDLELLRDNTTVNPAPAMGTKRNKRVIEDSDEESESPNADKESAPKKSRSLESMFSEEEEVAEVKQQYEDDELHDFIEQEESDDSKSEGSSPAAAKKPQFSWGSNKNISKEAWNDLMDIFGDGSDYAELVWEQDDMGIDSEDAASTGAVESDVDAPAELAIDPRHIPEEALWVQKELYKQFSLDTELPTIEACLKMMHQRLPVPFIAAFRKDQCVPMKLFHLWTIHDLNQQWIGWKTLSLSLNSASVVNAKLIADWVKKLEPHRHSDIGPLADQFAANVKAWSPLYSPIVIEAGIPDEAVLYQILLSEAIDPIVRKIEACCTVTTAITETGKRLGPRHELSPLLSLKDKNIQSFNPEQFALLSRAVHLHYCSISLACLDRSHLLDQLVQLFSSEHSAIVTVLFSELLDRIIKHVSVRLHRESATWIAQACGYEVQSRMTSFKHAAPFYVASYGAGQLLGIVRMENEQLVDYRTFNDSSWEFVCTKFLGREDPLYVTGCTYAALTLYQKLASAGFRPRFTPDDTARLQSKGLLQLYPQLQSQSPIIHYCVAAALRLTNSIAAFGVLADADLAKLDLHPHQSYIDAELLTKYVKRAVGNVVNMHGITADQWYLYGHIPNMSMKHKNCQSRAELDAVSSGFVTFPDSPNILDGFRICRDDYQIVTKMLSDAYEQDGGLTVSRLREQPHRLLSLDLSDYDRHLGGGKIVMLEEYRKALLCAHAPAHAWPAPTNEDVFRMICGEREDRLQPGRLVQVRLPMKAAGSSVIAHLEGSDVPVRCMLDEGTKKVGVYEAVVLSVNLSDFSPDSSGSNVVRVSVHKDDLGSAAPGRKQAAQPVPLSESRKNAVPSAVLHHPAFKYGISRADAEQLLRSSVPGEAIVRDEGGQLVVSWRCCSKFSDLIAHYPLLVDGGRFVLNSHRYEDIDEVIARGIEPNARLIDDILSCPKIVDTSHCASDKQASQFVEARLQEQQSHNPQRIAYGLWIARESPGAAILSMAPRHHERVDVDEGAYVFRRHRFATLPQLIEYLKSSR